MTKAKKTTARPPTKLAEAGESGGQLSEKGLATAAGGLKFPYNPVLTVPPPTTTTKDD